MTTTSESPDDGFPRRWRHLRVMPWRPRQTASRLVRAKLYARRETGLQHAGVTLSAALLVAQPTGAAGARSAKEQPEPVEGKRELKSIKPRKGNNRHRLSGGRRE